MKPSNAATVTTYCDTPVRLFALAAVLWGVVQDYQGQGYPVRYRMIREAGQWRIDELTMRRAWVSDSLSELPPESFI